MEDGEGRHPVEQVKGMQFQPLGDQEFVGHDRLERGQETDKDGEGKAHRVELDRGGRGDKNADNNKKNG